MGLPAKEEAANLYCFLRRELERVVAGPVPDLFAGLDGGAGQRISHASHLGASNFGVSCHEGGARAGIHGFRGHLSRRQA